jgi:predicted transcriptional regulator YdeE
MQFDKLSLPAFRIVGICVVTSNENGASQKDISDLWSRFFQESVSLQIANRESDDIYCAYTDYNPSDKAAYTCVIGHRVIGTAEIRNPLTEILVPESLYYVFDSSSANPSQVLETWKHIWSTCYPRTYQVDFDLYRSGPKNSEKHEIHSYISAET